MTPHTHHTLSVYQTRDGNLWPCPWSGTCGILCTWCRPMSCTVWVKKK